MRARTPIVFAMVAGLAFLVLMIAFRSVALPLVSIVLNPLSVGAAYGVITLIFQDGPLQGLLGFTSNGAIAQWVPLFMFVFLFGLSMDYHVFILSRIRERCARGMRTADAVTSGIAASAGVVTSAAVIMVAVFSIFETLSFVDVKTLGWPGRLSACPADGRRGASMVAELAAERAIAFAPHIDHAAFVSWDSAA